MPLKRLEGGAQKTETPPGGPPPPPLPRLDPYIYQSIALDARIPNICVNPFDTCRPKDMLPAPSYVKTSFAPYTLKQTVQTLALLHKSILPSERELQSPELGADPFNRHPTLIVCRSKNS